MPSRNPEKRKVGLFVGGDIQQNDTVILVHGFTASQPHDGLTAILFDLGGDVVYECRARNFGGALR